VAQSYQLTKQQMQQAIDALTPLSQQTSQLICDLESSRPQAAWFSATGQAAGQAADHTHGEILKAAQALLKAINAKQDALRASLGAYGYQDTTKAGQYTGLAATLTLKQ